eukprot:3834825-Alexandrium_andersonii.AAC.1
MTGQDKTGQVCIECPHASTQTLKRERPRTQPSGTHGAPQLCRPRAPEAGTAHARRVSAPHPRK